MSNIHAILHHSAIVSDLQRSLDFYCGVLQLPLDESRPDLGYPGAWLNVGVQQIHLLQLNNPDPIEGRPEHGGRDRHVALAVSDFDALAERLAAAGIAVTRSRSGRGDVLPRPGR